MLPGMEERVSLQKRLEGTSRRPRVPCAGRRSRARRPAACAARILAQIDRAVEIFEVDRLLYDIEVEAQHRWLRRMMAFDAYCARRDAAPAGAGSRPRRLCDNPASPGAWRSLVARTVRVGEVPSSNLGAPIASSGLHARASVHEARGRILTVLSPGPSLSCAHGDRV